VYAEKRLAADSAAAGELAETTPAEQPVLAPETGADPVAERGRDPAD
jgi:hypothetical protein